MTKSTKKKMVGPEAVIEAEEAMAQGMQRSAEAVQDVAKRSSEAYAEFLSTRMKQDMQFQRELVLCRDFATLYALQTSFMQAAVKDYAAQMQQQVAIGMAAMGGASAR